MKFKKIVTAVILAAACASFTGCGKGSDSSKASDAPSAAVSAESTASEKSLADRTAELKGSLTLPEMVDIKKETLSDRYGIDPADVKDFSAYICGSGAMPDEFGIFEAVDADAAARLKDLLEKRIERQRNTFKDYTPNEMYKFDDCFVEANGTTVSYAICEDNSKAKEIFK